MQQRMASLILAPAVAAVLFCIAPAGRAATDISNLGAISQPEFRLLSEDLGAALSDKPLTPTTPLGLTGLDIGVEATDTEIANGSVWRLVTNGNGSSSLVVPKIHLYKGLPLGFDVGAFYSEVPDSNIKFWGAELRYALLQGGYTEPTIGLSASYTRLQGVSQLGFHTTGLDLAISKGFAVLTPYAGIGEVWVDSTPAGIPGLQAERFSLNKYFIGTDLNLGILDMAVEADRTGSDTSYGLKLGWRF
ncbi:MAG: hypothetical protein M0Z84_00865 [Gammaproteobacteria bacterium]|nr:hypothetical protein [Gammaproteobacteria bacterium]